MTKHRQSVTTTEAAQTLGVTRRRVVALIEAGRLAAEKIGRDWLIDVDVLDAFKKLPRRTGWVKGRKRKPDETV